jgi:integrase
LEFEGKRYRESTKVKNRQKAEGIAAKFRTSLAERRVGIIKRDPAPKIEEAMKAFLEWSQQEHAQHEKTYIRYKTSSKPLLRFLKFKGKKVDSITASMIEDYKRYRARQKSKRTKKPITPATINRELACLKAMFFHVQKAHKHIENPVSEIEFLSEANEQDRILTYQEQRAYLAVASETLRDVACLMIETGMRPEEICRIRRGMVQLDLEAPYVHIPFGKTAAARRKVPLNDAAVGILRARLESAKGDCLFPHRKDDDEPMLKVNNAHTTALRKSKVKYFRLYDCRHTFATRAIQNGMDMVTVAAILGHSKLEMLKRYAHPQEDHKADAMKKLAVANAAAEIAEFEKLKVHTISHTAENPASSEPTVN